MCEREKERGREKCREIDKYLVYVIQSQREREFKEEIENYR